MIELHGWGRYPRVRGRLDEPRSTDQWIAHVRGTGPVIARGLGRSYGDSALGAHVLGTRYLDHLMEFDRDSGILTCQAGVTLADVLRVVVPRGWFLPVTPGTRWVTVGGAVSSDVHGKNHHRDGAFSAHVLSAEILLGSGERVTASRGVNPDLFGAVCGGMGLAGIVLSATLQLKAIRSSVVVETTIKCNGLDGLLDAFAQHRSSPYSVAWIDCTAQGSRMGRGLLMLGEHALDGPLSVRPGATLPIPFEMPGRLLNRGTARAFNALYWSGIGRRGRHRRLPLEAYFYPLDALAHWNRLYGRSGLVQYQAVVPRATGREGMHALVRRIAQSGCGSYLAVLKLLGPANDNPLSFPLEGFTLAVDFRAEPAVFELLDDLDRIVLDHGGRLYLAKDSRMTEAVFKRSYPRWQEFEETRSRWHAHGKFASAQSRRLGLA